MNRFSFKYRNLILGITATAVGYYTVLMPHTVFLNKYRDVVAIYRMEKEVPLNFKIQLRIQKVMDDLKLSNDIKNIIKPFSGCGLDLLHAGTLNNKYGAILGIPYNFTHTIEQLRTNLQVIEEPIDWSRQDAQNLLTALDLSEYAQKFAIANEILRIQDEEPYFNAYLLALIIATLWTVYNVITYRFRLRDHNIILCRTLYLSFTICGAILWFGIKDYQSYHLDRKNDEALCSLGAEYIKGGQEFYKKTLMRNRALRTLLEERGKRAYTAYGNEQTFLRQKHVPLTYRKDFFDSHLQNLDMK